ncbi:MAG: yusZ, partial [Bacteriovoracaceae bacterium]|nr:yusZ [Bacteriovoracaceae bacterium]
DCLVNNAGFGLFGALEDLSQTQIRQQMEVNFFGLLFLTQTLLPLLRKNRGRILNISSVVGYMGLPFTSLYSSSKFALEGLTESLYYEAKPFGVQVCLIEPGQHRTDFGKKLIYGEKSFEPFSPYFRFSKKFKEFRESSRKKPGVPSSSVVDKIVLLSEKKTIPLHVPIGIDAKLSYYLKKLLPAGLFFTLMYKIFSAKFFKISTEAETQQY